MTEHEGVFMTRLHICMCQQSPGEQEARLENLENDSSDFFFLSREEEFFSYSELNCLGRYGNYLLFGVLSLSLPWGDSYSTSLGPRGIVRYVPISLQLLLPRNRGDRKTKNVLPLGGRPCHNRRH